LELNWAGEIEVAVAREVGMVVGICVMDAAETGVVTAPEDDIEGVEMKVLSIKEDAAIEMTVVGSGAWNPADAAREEGSTIVVTGGMIILVLFSVNRGTELADGKERELPIVGIGGVPVEGTIDELGSDI
jgi:hypothetical protein